MLYCLGRELYFLSKRAMERLRNPPNVGVIEDADGVGRIGDAADGFDLELYIRVAGDTITDARFKAFGCAATIATVSMVSEMLEGRSLSEALDISDEEIAEALDGLPPARMHSAALGRLLVRAAVDDYRRRCLLPVG
jgi:nitrogen fixation NifU-like protein